MRLVFVLSLLLMVLASPARAQTGDELWQKVLAKYRECASFSCTGMAMTESAKAIGDTSHRSETSFRIRFQRPASLLVEWTDMTKKAGLAPRSALFTREGRVLGLPPHKTGGDEFQSLEQGMVAYAGVSSAMTYFLPQLLFGKPGYFRDGVATLGDDIVMSGRKAKTLKIATAKAGEWTLAIDAETLAILRAIKIRVVSKERAEAIRRQIEDELKKLGQPVPPARPAEGYTMASTIVFTGVVFDPVLKPEDFAFTRGQ